MCVCMYVFVCLLFIILVVVAIYFILFYFIIIIFLSTGNQFIACVAGAWK